MDEAPPEKHDGATIVALGIMLALLVLLLCFMLGVGWWI